MTGRDEAPQHAMRGPSVPGGRRGLSVPGLIAAAAGVVLFVYFVRRTGVADIAAGVGRLGWVFLTVAALGGLRLAARALAWRSCLDRPHRLTRWHAFRAMVAGDTAGNLTPLGPLVGEPAKTLFAGDREPASRTLPALAVENLFFTLSAALVVAGGAVALAFRLGPADSWWTAGAVLVGALVMLVGAVHGVIWRRLHPAGALLDAVARRAPAAGRLAGWAAGVRRAEDRVHDLYPRAPRRIAAVAGWELGFHALAVLEIHLVLAFVSDVPPTLLDAFVLESANRLLAAAFKVVPLRIGVDEAGTAAVAGLLGFGGAAGVTLAIVRKARMLVWMTAGVLLLARRSLPARRDGYGAAAATAGGGLAQEPAADSAVKSAAGGPEEDAGDRLEPVGGPKAAGVPEPVGEAESPHDPEPVGDPEPGKTEEPHGREPVGGPEPAGGPPAPAPRGPAVVVMARSPSRGRAPKTRLADVFPDERDRRRLYAAFLADVVWACRTVGTTLRVAYTPDGGPHGFAPAGIADGELMHQHGEGLGERERGIFEALFRDGFSPVVVIGSDLPGLPPARIRDALARLAAERDTVVLGPSADGGYYLIGLARPRAGDPIPDLFTGIRWSSAWTRADTLAAAERCGLRVELLDVWRDVDDAADLTALRTALAGGGAGRAPATAAVLDELAAGGRW